MADKNKTTRKATSKKTNKKATAKKTTAKKTTAKKTTRKRATKKKVDNSVINLWVRNEELDSLSKIEQVKMPIEYRMKYVRTFGVENIIDVNEYNRWIEFMKNPESSNGRFYPSSIFPNFAEEVTEAEKNQEEETKKSRFAIFSR